MSTIKYSKSYKVLSLDGGGMRGLYTASFLKSLVEGLSQSNDYKEKDIGKGFDLIVGTSTGGILACGLAAGIPIDKIIKLYVREGKKIFTNPFPPEKVRKQLIWGVRNSRKAANSNEALLRSLEAVFGKKTMGEIYRERQVRLCIPAVNLMDHSPRLFKTPHSLSEQVDNDRRLVDVCLATSASPICFPVVRLSDPQRSHVHEDFVDGGLWANDPILVALTEVIVDSGENQKIEIISIGTCPPPTGKLVLSKKNREGLLKWRFGVDLIELATDSQSKGSHFIADFLCDRSKKYFGKEIKVHKLKQTIPSVEQAPFLFIDQSGEQACSILMGLGKKDGRELCEKINKGDSDNILKEIFSSLPNVTNSIP